MTVVKKNTLGNFLKRLEKVEDYNFDKNNLIKSVQQESEEIARDEYAGTQVIVNSKIENSSVIITAQAKNIAYMEFGTGVLGEGTYPTSKLPKETLEFISRGGNQKTEGWQYNYYKKQNEKRNPNLRDWKGFEAKAQMYKTSNRIQSELGMKIAKEIKGEK